jgi:hypothetical protein
MKQSRPDHLCKRDNAFEGRTSISIPAFLKPLQASQPRTVDDTLRLTLFCAQRTGPFSPKDITARDADELYRGMLR